MKDLGRCMCGELIVSITYDGSRGILDRKADVVYAPLTTECMIGHKVEVWVTHEEAREHMAELSLVAR